jgi:RNA polymerase sigma-70 factor (ECF subfamily)
MYITQNREDALDVSQEVFLKLWRTLESFRGECSIKSYLMKLTKNTALDMKRRNSYRQTISLTTENDEGEASQLDIADTSVDANPQEAYIRRERIERVRRAISELDEEYRQVIVMREMNGMSYREISDALGINEGTVKSRINRARAALKKILTDGNIF